MNQACDHCDHGHIIDAEMFSVGGYMQCRRFPPIASEGMCSFPTTKATWHCGEFMPKTTTEEIGHA